MTSSKMAQLIEASENQNVRAFLKMLRHGEGTDHADGYRTLFGGSFFDSFNDHPGKVITAKLGGKPIRSSAAGAYQFLRVTWNNLVIQYGFEDFSPKSQDLACIALIIGRGALKNVIDGDFERAVIKCNREWASLPYSPYGQPTVTMDLAKQLYSDAGGSFA